MKIFNQRFNLPLISSLLLLLAACGGGDGSGSGGGDGFTPTLPANALRVSQANAADIASEAVGSIENVSSTTEIVTALKAAEERPSFVEIARWAMRRGIHRQFVAARTVSEDCGQSSADGRIVGTTTETGDRVTSELRFEECNLLGLLVIDGQINFDGTINDTSGAYDVSFSGNFSITFDTEPTVTMIFNAHEVGNDRSGAYTLDFAISIDGPPEGGFLMETTEDLVGNHLNEEVYAGTIILYGAGNTRLRMEVIGTDLVDIDIDEGTGVFEDFDVVDLNML